jgi:hypothetical protein
LFENACEYLYPSLKRKTHGKIQKYNNGGPLRRISMNPKLSISITIQPVPAFFDNDFSSPSAVVDKYLKIYLLACILLNVTISATHHSDA